MKVAIVHDWLTAMRGGERCLEVFCELFPDADLYTLIYLPDRVSPVIRSMNVRSSWLNRLPGVGRYYRHCLPLFPRAIESFDLSGYDLVLSSSHCVAKGVSRRGAVHISYVYSPMRYLWDLHDAYFGPDSPWASRVGMALCRPFLQRWDVRSAQRVDHFVAISRHIAEKIRRIYKREAVVINPPVDVERFYLQDGRGEYYLVVSALVPYKRIDLAVEAFNRLKLPLKIVGAGPQEKRLWKMAGAHVDFLGEQSDETIAGLYAGCRALIFPGEEDFGIVPLEAQASGKPVIAYGAGGVLETVVPLNSESPEAPTGIFFHQQTVPALVEAVRLFESERGRFDGSQLRRHASKFSRPRFKAAVRAFVDEKWTEYQNSRAHPKAGPC